MDLPESVRKYVVDGYIDFTGQRHTYWLMHTGLTLATLVSFVVGWFRSDVFLTLYTALAGATLTALLVLPPWPMYKTHPTPWISHFPFPETKLHTE